MRIVRKSLSGLSTNELKTIESFLDFNFSTIFHEPNFNRIIEEVFNTQFAYNLVYNSNGKLIALCPLHSIKNGLLKKTYSDPWVYEVPYGGWVYDRGEVNLSDLINQIKLSFNEEIIFSSFPLLNKEDFSQIEKKTGYQTAIIDLTMSEDTIWRNCINQKRRNMIRKANENNILVENFDYSRFEDYYLMMEEASQFTGIKVKPKEYFIKILKAYFPNNKAVILLAKKQSNLLSGIILLRNRHICHYWISARNRKVENLGQGELLQWEAIKWAKKNGSRYYDLCVVEPERLPHIAAFKLGFSREIVPFYLYTKSKISYKILRRTQKIFRKKRTKYFLN